jgi:hypothetical protein
MTVIANDQSQPSRKQLFGFITVEQMLQLAVLLVVLSSGYAKLSSRMDSMMEAQERQEQRDDAQDARLTREEAATSDDRVWKARAEATLLRIETKVDGLREQQNAKP